MLLSSRKLIAIAIGTLSCRGADGGCSTIGLTKPSSARARTNSKFQSPHHPSCRNPDRAVASTSRRACTRGRARPAAPARSMRSSARNLATPWVKEISDPRADGETLCSDLGIALQPRAVIASRRVKDGISIEVVEIGDLRSAWSRSAVRSPGQEQSGRSHLAGFPDREMALNGGGVSGYASLMCATAQSSMMSASSPATAPPMFWCGRWNRIAMV